MKCRLYIDEVGNPDLGSSNKDDHRFLCLAGVIFDLKYVNDILNPQIEVLKRKYFGSHPDDPVIFHRKELLYKKPPFSVLKDPKIEKQFNEELLKKLKEWEYTVIAVTIDKREHVERYSTWRYDPYHYCQEVLIERYRLFLDIEDKIGDVMFESRGGKEDRRLKDSFRRITTSGTNHLSSEQILAHLTSKELKIKPKSANISGLQVADLIAHPARRWFFKNVFDNTEDKLTFGDEIIKLL